jgi:hypothetical protein
MMTDSQSSLIRGAVSLALQDDARGEAVSMADMTFSCVSAQRHKVWACRRSETCFPSTRPPVVVLSIFF